MVHCLGWTKPQTLLASAGALFGTFMSRVSASEIQGGGDL